MKEIEWLVLPETKEGYQDRYDRAKAKMELQTINITSFKDDFESLNYILERSPLEPKDYDMNERINHLGDEFEEPKSILDDNINIEDYSDYIL